MNSLIDEILSSPDDLLFEINNEKFTLDFTPENNNNIFVYSDKMLEIYDKLRKVYRFNKIPILIEGETGTGKEIIAKYIHYGNPDAKGAFIGLNGSNLSKELFESELFGYEKGAFTGAATTGKEGKIHEAKHGTLFLDEISEISMDIQAKLLRVLQEREYYKVGGNTPFSVETRFIFASNKNLTSLVKNGLFREDLYYRINVCEVELPPLRKRIDEIIPLSISFIKLLSKEFDKKITCVSAGFLKKLYFYDFPGNVRELKNIITKVILFNETNNLLASDLTLNTDKKPERDNTNQQFIIDPQNIILPDTPFNLEKLEKNIVYKTLERFKGNKTKTADFLGLTRIQLYGKYKNDRIKINSL